MKTLLLSALAIATGYSEPVTLPLWNGEAPGEAGQEIGPETSADRDNDGIVRISNVSKPSLTVFPAPAESANGAAVIVAPGGGYNILASSHEGSEVCKWLNGIGVTAVLLKYRVPRRANLAKHHAPMQDAQRAVSLVRSNAKDWQLDPGRIGILGFSAGGHLAATVLTSDGSVTFPKKEVDQYSPIPDFGILVYPAYLKNEEDPNRLSPEIAVDRTTPPCFVLVGHQDSRYVEGSALFYLAMQRAKRPCELHIFGKGGHGFGMKNLPQRISQWTDLTGGWMDEMGFLTDTPK